MQNVRKGRLSPPLLSLPPPLTRDGCGRHRTAESAAFLQKQSEQNPCWSDALLRLEKDCREMRTSDEHRTRVRPRPPPASLQSWREPCHALIRAFVCTQFAVELANCHFAKSGLPLFKCTYDMS